jgi:diguanylate cyclase (GGDEF)-like protein/putative nucleotidyltransferase with HDIG domain
VNIRHTRWLHGAPGLSQREPALAGQVGGALYLAAGLFALLLLVLPGTEVTHGAVLAPLGLASVVYGLLCATVFDWRHMPAWVLPAGTIAGLVCTSLAVYATDGFDSPMAIILVFVVVYAACFHSSRLTVVSVAGAVVAHELPLLYDAYARAQSAAASVLSVTLVFGALAAVIVAGRTLLLRLTDEHAAVRDLATAVAAGAPPADVCVLASRRIATLLGVDACGILEFTGAGEAIVSGAWSDSVDAPALKPGTVLPIVAGDDLHRVASEGHAVRVDRQAPNKRAARLGYGCSLTAPIPVRGHMWGAIAVASVVPDSLPDDVERVLADFAEIIGLAVANTEAQERLLEQASTDPLTGLFNHRAFHERLREELSRARRHDRPLALALLDIDHFKAINDSLGHERGDAVLAAVAARLTECARSEDILARLGGDEFAVLMPETTEGDSLAAVERTRRAIAAIELEGGLTVSASAGVCGVEHAQDADALVRLADGALYWSKAHGRDAACIYDASVVRELSITERAEQLQRSRALVGIRALARAIDAKDPSTQEHSQRVATLACAIARCMGWSEERIALLEEAALVHDVGKIGVPDAVLLKPGRLTDDEYEQIKRHAPVGAQMVEDVLLPEQVAWIRAHHERPDGRGYPDSIGGDAIPDGAAILAVADAFDVMTATRIYSSARSREDALAECERLIGAQFAPAPVAALLALDAPEPEALTASAL